MIHMNIKRTSALIPDGSLIHGVGPLSQGKHLSVLSRELHISGQEYQDHVHTTSSAERGI